MRWLTSTVNVIILPGWIALWLLMKTVRTMVESAIVAAKIINSNPLRKVIKGSKYLKGQNILQTSMTRKVKENVRCTSAHHHLS